MADDTDTTSAESDADFGAGFSGKPAEKTPAKEKPEAAETPGAEETPEFIQITAKDWAEVRAAAAKTASYDSQLSKAFGTIGNLQKLVNAFQAPKSGRIEIPKTAFAKMERDFPELAQQVYEAMQASLSGVSAVGSGEADEATIKRVLAEHTSTREIKALEDEHPDWRQIVGAVDVTREQPDPNNPFRKWLGTKDAAYQARINGSESSAVIGKAIRLFQNETKAPPKMNGTPRDTARADRIRSAVQPRGDNAGAAPGKTGQDEFEEGFRSR